MTEALAGGQDVLLELELVGAREVKRRLPEAVMIFIAPPSLVELERRLRGRGTDSEERIQKRLARAREEIRAIKEFDYVVVNDMLTTALTRLLQYHLCRAGAHASVRTQGCVRVFEGALAAFSSEVPRESRCLRLNPRNIIC